MEADLRDAAFALARQSVERAQQLYGPFSQITLIGLVSLGTMLSSHRQHAEAIQLFRDALKLAQRTMSDHPIIGRLVILCCTHPCGISDMALDFVLRISLFQCCHIGRNLLAIGKRKQAVNFLQHAFALYQDIFGKAAVDYVVPLITFVFCKFPFN